MEKDVEWLLSEKYDGKKTEGFFADLKRLEEGEPLAYVIGHVPFLGTKIFLDSKPLIPRPETEYWTQKAIEEIGQTENPVRILDLCAGSGCIGVSLLKHIPHAKVDFVEIEPAHLETIRKNLRENDVDIERARFIQSDLFENVKNAYDYIFSNPPYIDAQIDRTQESVKQYEPHIALYGGDKGLALISIIIQSGSKYLKEGGEIYLEHEPEQEEQVYQLATENALEATSFPDQFGIIRYTVLSNTKI